MTRLTWLLIAVSLLVASGLLVAAFFLGRRARKTSEPSKPINKARSPASAWRMILSQLPQSTRALPVVVVLGERGSGKSHLIRSVFEARTGFLGDAVTARDDFSVSAFAPGPLLIQEVAGELFEAEGSDRLVQLHDLWQGMALQIALVVFVGSASTGAERQAQRIRRILDLLTDLRRGSAPRCCVCVSRLDESCEGFAELVGAAEHAGSDTLAPISIASASELRAVWDERFRDCYYAALGALPASEFTRAVRFPEQGGPELASYVDALLRSLFRGRVAAAPTLLALSALPEHGAQALLGDPFAPDDARLEADRRVLEQRRALRSAAVAVGVAGSIAVLYGFHHETLQHANQALATLRAAAAHARGSDRALLGILTRDPEVQAVSAVDLALEPIYPPLRWAFPKEKSAAVQDFLVQVRSLHLEPLTVSPDRATRVYAAALLYATHDGPLGRAVRSDAQRWATALGMPLVSVEHYVEQSSQGYSKTLSAAQRIDQDVGSEEWSAFFVQLDAVLARGKLERPEELAELRARAERLTTALRWAVQEPELRPLIQLFELERGKAELEVLLGGKNAALLQAPPWVIAHRDALQAVLALVKTGTLATPAANGKNLRETLEDLDSIGAGAESTGPAVTLDIDGTSKRYQPAAWATLLARSRASLYLDNLLHDLSATSRSLFFVDTRSYPDLPPSPVLGRGPSSSIPGRFTKPAFTTEIRGPLSMVDEKLSAAGASLDQRAALKAIRQRELDAYASGLTDALLAYLQSFRFDASDVVVLRSYLADSSWFVEFLANIAACSSLDASDDNDELRGVRRAVSSLAPIGALMTEDKGAYPNLQAYSAIVAKLLPALATDPLLGAEPRTGALADRLSPIGKLGLVLLDPSKPGPLQELEDWLTKSNVLDDKLREPFRLPVRAVYEQALSTVEQAASASYSNDLRPLVVPILAQFPFDPSARVDATPAEVLAVLGPKGSFSSQFQDTFGPLTTRDPQGNWRPRKVLGYRALALSNEALGLGRWATVLAPFLWNESGAPQPIALVMRPVSLAKVATGAADAPTLAVLRSGATTLAAFNQATTWKTLPVEWWTASPAALGLEFTSLDGASRRALSAEAPGAAWRFFHLLRRASISHGLVRWSLDDSPDHDVAFELRSDPWQVLVPPLNQSRLCVLETAWDGT